MKGTFMNESFRSALSAHSSDRRASRLVAALALVLLLSCAPFALAGCSSQSGEAPAADESAQTADGASDEAALSVQVVVDSSAADGSASFDGAVDLAAGATVLDALEATGLDVVVENSTYGAYVDAIDGLATGAHGSASGWVYTVNGESIMENADSYELADGDAVAWTYLV